MICLTEFMANFLKKFLIGLILNGSCSVIIVGVFVDFPASRAKRPLAGFQRWTWRMSIFSFLIISLRSLNCFESFLCLIGRRMTRISSFSRFFANLSKVSYGPTQTIGLNFERSRNFANRYICNSAPPERGVSVKRRMFF